MPEALVIGRVHEISRRVTPELTAAHWGNPGAAIGKRIRERLKAPWREVIGVISDERDEGVNVKAPAIALWPMLMDDFSGNPIFKEVTRMFVGHGLGLAGIGIGCGLVAAVALTRVMSSLLFDVSPVDPPTYAAVSLGLVATAVLASYVPALRATSVDPVVALRAE